MRPTLAIASLFLWVCVFASGASAQRQLQLYATILDSKGAPAATVTPEDVRVQENDTDLKILKVEPIEWTTKVQIRIDNGSGIGGNNLNQLRNGVRGLLESLPPGIEVTLVTTASATIPCSSHNGSPGTGRGDRPARATARSAGSSITG